MPTFGRWYVVTHCLKKPTCCTASKIILEQIFDAQRCPPCRLSEPNANPNSLLAESSNGSDSQDSSTLLDDVEQKRREQKCDCCGVLVSPSTAVPKVSHARLARTFQRAAPQMFFFWHAWHAPAIYQWPRCWHSDSRVTQCTTNSRPTFRFHGAMVSTVD